MIDIANQIGNLLVKYLPYTDTSSIGYDFPVEDVLIENEKVTLTLSQDDYTSVKSIMDGGNYFFTTHGFYTKNNIISFEPYNGGIGDYFAIEVKFEKALILSQNQQVTLKGFTDTEYNITYKVIRILAANRYVLYPITTVPLNAISSGLGYYPVQYTEGFNDIVELTDEGSNQVSFDIDVDSYYYVDSTSKLDLLENIKIYYYLDNIKVIDAEVFEQNIGQGDNLDYIIVDTASLSGTPMRSRNQSYDSDYYSTNRSGSFDKNYTINIKYLMQRRSDDPNNQTTSGSDIAQKQMDMQKTLTSILRTPLEGDSSLKFTAMTILSDEVEKRVTAGKVLINFPVGFVATYFNDILLKNDIKSYPIDFLQVNNDTLSF